MATKKQPVSKWFDGTTPLEELSDTEQLAHQIALERGDLGSSIARIMDAEIGDEAILTALTSFHESLSNPGDENRDPRVAIANASA
ncbi:hypothetical protein [Ilumatobacter coccineus]|jgi:hypothetical protein|uniref:Uncharacterized protein n=1 Tax=Ilumatobacter coccineus (strain NBRC 103263 / KCTC 29153 / YM16-304) TaxID=1313172 RepID=A0A6C7E557_ILUCY|nr:hypothetical protein [Ilumatobacter coccineus]BAN00395.1 hypothetical protein YM304_00810 [Ilumatobacter coccineus YM16-304]